MDQLTQLGVKYKTDKAIDHNFTPFYDSFLNSYRETFKNVLEIGVQYGPSIRMWSDYFPNANIYGADIKLLIEKENDRIFLFDKIDQSNRDDLEKLINQSTDEFDLIIDDGGHTMEQQQISLGYLFSFVKPGGFYILEDIHTSFQERFNDYECHVNIYHMLANIVNYGKLYSNYMTKEEINYIDKNISSFEFYTNSPNLSHSVTCIIQKRK